VEDRVSLAAEVASSLTTPAIMRVALAPIVLLTVALSAAGNAGAATLADVAAALAAPADAAQATNDWSSFTSLKTAQWKGKAPAKGGDKYYWNGKLPLDGQGAGEVSLVGTVTVPKKVELGKIGQVVAAQFPKDAKLEQVRGACPDERMSGSRIYRVTLAGRKPLYLHAQSVTEDRGGSFSTFELEPQRNRGWIC
jgi:hypothetical protein